MAEQGTSEETVSAPRGANRPRRKALPVYRVPNGSLILLRKPAKKAVRAPEQKAHAEEPSEEELAALIAALDEANAAAERVIAALDRSHEVLQSCIRDLRSARSAVAAGSDACV